MPVGSYGRSFDGLKNRFSYHRSSLTGWLGDWAPWVKGAALTPMLATPVLAGAAVGDEIVTMGRNVAEGRRADDLLAAHEIAAHDAVGRFPTVAAAAGLPGGEGAPTGAGGSGGGSGSGGIGAGGIGAGGIGAGGIGSSGVAGGSGTPGAPGGHGPGVPAGGADPGGGAPGGPPAGSAPGAGTPAGVAGAAPGGQGLGAPGPASTAPGAGGADHPGTSGGSGAGDGPSERPRVLAPQALTPDASGAAPFPQAGTGHAGSGYPAQQSPGSSFPGAGPLPGYLPGAGADAGPSGRGLPVPRSGADFGSGLLRNHAGRIPVSAAEPYAGRPGGWAGPSRGAAPPGHHSGGALTEPTARGVAEPATGRPGAHTGGYAPMGPGGVGRAADQEHRNRYLLPGTEVFDVDLPCTPPVLGAPDDGEEDR